MDETEFSGLIKGLKLRGSKNEMMRKNSLEILEVPDLQ
jgi:hypothetical protein